MPGTNPKSCTRRRMPPLRCSAATRACCPSRSADSDKTDWLGRQRRNALEAQYRHADDDTRNRRKQSAEKIIETAKRNGAKVSGPIPLPTEKQIVTILRAVHKYKDSREQFERRTHKRLIDIINPNQATIEALTTLDLPAGVEFEVKL